MHNSLYQKYRKFYIFPIYIYKYLTFIKKALKVSIYIYIYIHISYNENEHTLVYSLKLLTNFGMEVSGHFKLYQVFMHNFFVSKCLDIPIIYISYKKNQHIFMEGF